MLPKIRIDNDQHWGKIHDAAQTPGEKAIIGALMLLASDIQQVHETLSVMAVELKDRNNAEK